MNRARVAAAFDVGPEALVTVNQVHSATALPVSAPFDSPKPDADGIVTDRPGLVLAVLSADCQPVLFSDPEARVIGAAHAGWKGALTGILEATVEAMERLGATRDRIRAVIGPTIGPAAYEVGPEFLSRFTDLDPDNARFFTPGEGDRAFFDLPGYSLNRLARAGVSATWTGHSTYEDADRFYSYRRSVHRGEPDYGRLISAIRL